MIFLLRNNLDIFPTVGQGGLKPPVGAVRIWHYQAQSECLVQCSGVGAEEGWQPMVLH